MLWIHEDEHGARPRVHCDLCNGLIEYADQGWYMWEIHVPNRGPMPLYLLHKRCTRAFEAKHRADSPDVFLGSMEIRALPAYLASNLGITIEDSLEHAEMASRF